MYWYVRGLRGDDEYGTKLVLKLARIVLKLALKLAILNLVLKWQYYYVLVYNCCLFNPKSSKNSNPNICFGTGTKFLGY